MCLYKTKMETIVSKFQINATSHWYVLHTLTNGILQAVGVSIWVGNSGARATSICWSTSAPLGGWYIGEELLGSASCGTFRWSLNRSWEDNHGVTAVLAWEALVQRSWGQGWSLSWSLSRSLSWSQCRRRCSWAVGLVSRVRNRSGATGGTSTPSSAVSIRSPTPRWTGVDAWLSCGIATSNGGNVCAKSTSKTGSLGIDDSNEGQEDTKQNSRHIATKNTKYSKVL